jgi:DNA-binding XRE family transcriptional regulator
LTQECLAELLGIHWQTVSNIERGLNPFAVTTFAEICQYLAVAPEKLLLGIPAPNAARTQQIKKAMERRRKPPGSKE